ncbi:TTC28 [Scenedesmus sp. PABB004]|nr:TTC28 [Scenedesmus sp. PABB004]
MELRDLARAAFAAGRFEDALALYLQALALVPADAPPAPGGQPAERAALAANASAALLRLNRADEALAFADAAAEASPGWPKAQYRRAAALAELDRHGEAAAALARVAAGLEAAGEAGEAAAVRRKLCAATAAAAAAEQHLQVQSELAAAHAGWAAAHAREVRPAASGERRTGQLLRRAGQRKVQARRTLTPPAAPCQAAGRQALLGQLRQGMAGHAWEPADWEWRPTWAPSMRDDADDDGDRGGTAPAGLLGGLAGAFDGSEQRAQTLGLVAGLSTQLAELDAPRRGLALLRDAPLLSWYARGLAAALQGAGPGAHVLVLGNGGGAVLGLLAAAAGAARVTVVERARWGFRAAQQLLAANAGLAAGRVEAAPVPLACVRVAARRPEGAAGPPPEQGELDHVIPQAADVVVTDLIDYRLRQFGRASPAAELLALDLQAPGGAGEARGTVTLPLAGPCNALALWCELAAPGGERVSGGPADDADARDCCGVAHSLGQALRYLDTPLLPQGAAAAAAATAGDAAAAEPQTAAVAARVQRGLRLSLRVEAGPGPLAPAATWAPHGAPRQAMLPRWHFDMIADDARNAAYDGAIRPGARRDPAPRPAPAPRGGAGARSRASRRRAAAAAAACTCWTSAPARGCSR